MEHVCRQVPQGSTRDSDAPEPLGGEVRRLGEEREAVGGGEGMRRENAA